MYRTIINPRTSRRVSIFSKIGRRLLLNYINYIGGNPIADDSSGNDVELPTPPPGKYPETSRAGTCGKNGCQFKAWHRNAHKYRRCPECGNENVGWIVEGKPKKEKEPSNGKNSPESSET